MDSERLGEQAGMVLENEAFRTVCEGVQEDLRKAFLSDDDEAALKARYEVKAVERFLTRFKRMQEKGRHLRNERLKAQDAA